MKFSIGIIVLFAITWSSTDTQRHQEEKPNAVDTLFRIECAKELKIPGSEMETYTGPVLDNLDEATGHCFLKCFLEKQGNLDSNNGFKIDYIKFIYGLAGGSSKNSSLDDLQAIKKECVNVVQQEANACKTTFLGFQCILTKVNELVDLKEKSKNYEN